jgi:hypothetical protein
LEPNFLKKFKGAVQGRHRCPNPKLGVELDFLVKGTGAVQGRLRGVTCSFIYI